MASESASVLDRWRAYLASPPPAVVDARKRLLARAEQLVRDNTPTRAVPANLDVVVAGSGFLSLYFLGVHSVLAAMERAGHTSLHRFAGASSGAQTPFEIKLTGEEHTLDCYLANGLLQDEHPVSLVGAAIRADRHWRAFGEHIFATYGEHLSRCDGRCFMSVTFPFSRPFNVLYSDFSSDPKRAAEAFYATGTLLTKCDGRWATDGGVSNNKPRFGDGARPSLLVDPTRAGLPLSMAARYSLAQAVDAVERGQEDAASLFLAPWTMPGGAARRADGTVAESVRRGVKALWIER